MQNIYAETRSLDAACCVSYGLTEEIMMENAAMSLESCVRGQMDKRSPAGKNRVLILCGNGNNGADGYALARRLRIDFDVVVFQCEEPKSALCRLQAERAGKCGTKIFGIHDFTFEFLQSARIIVDCIYGSGFHGELDEKILCVLSDVNEIDCIRIACDIPSGISGDGTVCEGAFKADVTVTMGALKLALFSDSAKDFVGDIECGDLGVGRRLFENASATAIAKASLLEESDAVLPSRVLKNVNKGTFGHTAVVSGEKRGASILAAKAAMRFGSGLVSLVDMKSPSGLELVSLSSPELMVASSFPEKTMSVALGMGVNPNDMQPYFDFLLANKKIPCVLDAGACSCEHIKAFLEQRTGKTVLTPHPKEFQSLLRLCGLGEYSLPEISAKRAELIESFCTAFPRTILLSKGANTMIGCNDGRKYHLYVNTFGSPALSKGGSGDVLSGMIASLQAQRYPSLDAALTASIAHALASRKIEKTYAMTPQDLIAAI